MKNIFIFFVFIINILISSNATSNPLSMEEKKVKELIQLHLEQKDDPLIIPKILGIMKEIQLWPQDAGYCKHPIYSGIPTYNGTDERFADILVWVSQFTTVNLTCEVIEKTPSLILATTSLHGSSKDNRLPRLDVFKFRDYQITGVKCKTSFPINEFKKYVMATTLADRDYLKNRMGPDGGTISFAIMKEYVKTYASAIWAPWLFTPIPSRYKFPYEDWAEKSKYNKKIFRHIKQKYLIAKKKITTYWVSKGYDQEKAESFARRSLFKVPFGTIPLGY